MTAGRPTKYKTEFVNQVFDYLQTVGRQAMELPTRYGFSQYIGVNDDTLVEWEKLYPDFSAALKRIDNAQREQLMNDGMYGGKEVNSTMAIFLLKANHGMIETQRTEITGKDGEDLKVNLVSYDKPDDTV